MDVTVLVPILNEERYLPETLPLMLGQDFQGSIEFLLLDGGSTDGTAAILQEAAANDSRVRVLDNPGRIQSCALNIGLSQAQGKYIVRMDAHTFYPLEYIRTGVHRLEEGDVAWVAGPQIALGDGVWSERIAAALSSPIGVGGAGFRLEQDAEIEADTGFTGIISRQLLEEVGGWSEDWPINEDGELAARITGRGQRIVCLPAMAARCVTRGSPSALARQYWRYGYYRAKTLTYYPRTLRKSHLLPPALVASLAAWPLMPRSLQRILSAGYIGYLAVLIAVAVRGAKQHGVTTAIGIPVVLLIMHLSWGAGLLLGLVRWAKPPWQR